jgi:hypothetical protein
MSSVRRPGRSGRNTGQGTRTPTRSRRDIWRKNGKASPERLFERRWATSLLDRAVARLEAESIASGKAGLLSAVLPTLTGGRSEVPLAAIAAELGMTEGAVKMAASRLRRCFGEILREEIARTLADPADVEEEIRALFAALARKICADLCDLGRDFPFS